MYRQNKTATDRFNQMAAVRKALVDELGKDEAQLSTIGRLTLELAKLEGEHEVYALADSILVTGYDQPMVALRDLVMQKLTSGADDTWSGRSNDLSRARFDGVREAAREVSFFIQDAED